MPEKFARARRSVTGDGSLELSSRGPGRSIPWDITLSAFIASGGKCQANEVPCMPSTVYLHRVIESVAVIGETRTSI